MVTRAQNVKLGVFVLGTLVLTAFVLLVVSGVTVWQDRETYYVETGQTVAGLEVGTPVTMRGVPVGRVDAIALHPGRADMVQVTLRIDEEVRIPRDSKAFFRMAGVTGQKVLDLDEGTTGSGTLPPGSAIPRGFTTLQELEGRALEVADDAAEVAEKTKELMSKLVDITESVDPERVRSIVEDADEIAENLRDASAELDDAIAGTRSGVDDAVVSVKDAADRTGEMVDDAKKAVKSLRSLVDRGDGLVRDNEDDVERAIGNLRRATSNMEDLTRELRQRPSRLLFATPPPERELP